MLDHAIITKIKFILACTLVLAVLANGLFFWLSKSQLINIDHINDTTYISNSDYQKLSLNDKQRLVEQYKSLFYFFEYDDNHDYQSTFEALTNQYQSILKLVKDVFIGLIIIFLFAYAIKINSDHNTFQKTWLRIYSVHISIFLSLLMIAIYLSMQKFSSFMIMASGIRSLYFLFIALLLIAIQRFNSNSLMKTLAYTFLAIAIIQLPFVVTEYLYGTEVFNGSSLLSIRYDRVVGTFNQPSSLAVFMVMSLILWSETFAKNLSKPVFGSLIILVLFYVLSAASAMGILLFILFSAYLLSHRLTHNVSFRLDNKQLFIGIIIVLLLLLISHFYISYVREDYLDSLWFRITKYYQYVQSVSFTTLLFGQGLGSGTNTAYQLATQLSAQITDLAQINPSFDYKSGFFITDSMLLTLIAQIGIIATLLIYSCLVYGAIYIKPYRISFIALIIASLSTNINELFPLHILLSLLLSLSYIHFKQSDKK